MINSVLGWLDRAAELYPDKPAYFDDTGELSFGELRRVTLSVGSFLAAEIPAGSAVICMASRSRFTPAYFLSAVRAGCFYAPIDAAMPASRLRQMIAVADTEYMLVDRENAAKAAELGFEGKVFIAEDVVGTPVDEELLARAVSGFNELMPLYMIFTSGSTGVPKGVLTSHRSLMNYIEAVTEVLEATDSDVFGGQAPLDYIAAVRDIYIPLYTGASTVIIPKKVFAMPTELFGMLNAYGVTALCWSVAGVEVPAKLNAFSEVCPESLRVVLFSGSVIAGRYLRVWQQALPDTVFINQYGPTEATASCTYYIVRDEVTDETVLPIGRPYRNYTVTILHEDNTRAAVGEQGEICITGPSLALGYYNDPERTAASFVQNPLNTAYPERMYRTGDYGSVGEDGELRFHGRMDRQIKHMGHRIELEEIEAAAKRVDGVSECCALYQKEKELLYLFYTGEATAKEISQYFRANMPAFMAPRKMINLDEMPTLPNGKLDMTALKARFK